ncbi:UNVERIFIED_CONTAM: hypothetical protein Slati_2197800 [Sesamum latifolium]|uniref:Uncharacterized protein n=1 Tax=Sesamum latifolium TaxID=2727402 RepID=A0AAW2WVF6_9LAMI
MALTLVITARKLRLYLLPSGGQNQFPGRLVKWTIELSEYDISYLPRTTIKAQTLADFMSEMTGTTQEEVSKRDPGYFT